MDSGCWKELFYYRTLGVEDVTVTKDIQIAVNHEFTIGRLTIDNIGCMNLFYPIYLRIRFGLSKYTRLMVNLALSCWQKIAK